MSDRNPFGPPEASVGDLPGTSRDIASLPVSESWKTKFRLIEKAGGPKMQKFKELKFGERFKISFNILAFLFGPIYYAVKGMWKRGLSMFAIAIVAVVVLSLILEMVGLGRFGNALSYGVAGVFAVRANLDHYKKWVLNDNGWW